MRGHKSDGQMQPSEQNGKVHSQKTESGRTISASIPAYKSEGFDTAGVCVDTAVTRGERAPSGRITPSVTRV